MFAFFKRQQDINQAEETKQRRKPMAFSEIVDEIGDFSDLAENDVQFKFWLPEAAKQALHELSERSELSESEFIRQFLAIHCYGLYAFYQMTDKIPKLFKEQQGIKYSKSIRNPPDGKKRVNTYWVPELGKNIAAVKVWIPKRMKDNLKVLAEHTQLTPSNYVREILISRMLGHGMLPQRPTMFNIFPTQASDDWSENRDIPWREVSQDEFYDDNVGEVRTEWVDA